MVVDAELHLSAVDVLIIAHKGLVGYIHRNYGFGFKLLTCSLVGKEAVA